jgi:uncharacterized protein (TIGR02118 family)
MFIVQVIYRTPEDPERFNEAYFGTHVPLVQEYPGLRALEISTGAVAADQDAYLVALLMFETRGAATVALESQEAAKSLENLDSFAAGFYSVISYETVSVLPEWRDDAERNKQ